MKAREIRVRLYNKVEPDVLHVLEALAEDNNVLREQLLQLALMHDQVVNIVGEFSQVAANMKNAVDVMQKKESDIDDSI